MAVSLLQQQLDSLQPNTVTGGSGLGTQTSCRTNKVDELIACCASASTTKHGLRAIPHICQHIAEDDARARPAVHAARGARLKRRYRAGGAQGLSALQISASIGRTAD